MPNIRTFDHTFVERLGAPQGTVLGMENEKEMVIFVAGFMTAMDLEIELTKLKNARDKLRHFQQENAHL